MFSNRTWIQPQMLMALLAITPTLAQSPKLSISKVEQLIASKVPDSVVAREIQNRGMDPAPTKANLEGLRRKGAGTATLAAVRALIWFGGHLNLQVAPADARVEIIGPDGRRYQSTPELPLGVGNYVIKTTKANFRPDTRTFVMEDGQRSTLSITLTPDPAYLRSKEQRIRGDLRYRDAMTTINASKELLAMDPVNVAARGFLASGHWKGFHGKEFRITALDALKAGANVEMSLFHEEHHRGRTTTFRHDVQVAIMPAGFLFDPGITAALSCSLRRMEIPFSALIEVKVSETHEREPYLLVKAGLREQPGDYITMKLFLTKTTPEKPGVRSNQFNRLAADAPPESAPIEMLETLRSVIKDKGGPSMEHPPLPQDAGVASAQAHDGEANRLQNTAVTPRGDGATTPKLTGSNHSPSAAPHNRIAVAFIAPPDHVDDAWKGEIERLPEAFQEAVRSHSWFELVSANPGAPPPSNPTPASAADWGRRIGVRYVVFGTRKARLEKQTERGYYATLFTRLNIVDVKSGKVEWSIGTTGSHTRPCESSEGAVKAAMDHYSDMLRKDLEAKTR